MLNNTYYMYLVCWRMISRAADEMIFNHSWWKCHTASELGMDHSTGPILVWFWHFMPLHCIALHHWSKGTQGSSRSHRHVTSPCRRTQDAGYLNYPAPGTPVLAVTTDVRPTVNQLGIILQSLNRVRDGTRGMCQAGWKFCLNKCNFTKCSCGNRISHSCIFCLFMSLMMGWINYTCHGEFTHFSGYTHIQCWSALCGIGLCGIAQTQLIPINLRAEHFEFEHCEAV